MTKPHNRIAFYSTTFGKIELVRASVGFYSANVPVHGLIRYWRGQAVNDVSGKNDQDGMTWYYSRGRIVWLNSSFFTMINPDETPYTNT